MTNRTRAGITAAAFTAVLAASAPAAQAADRWTSCSWKYKPKNGDGVRTITYKVGNGVPADIVTGVESWDGPVKNVNLVPVSSDPDFIIEMKRLNANDYAATGTPTSLFNPAPGAHCGGGAEFQKGYLRIYINSDKIASMGWRLRQLAGAHEMGHMFGMDHWYAKSGSGSGWWWSSIMGSPYYERHAIYTPSAIDVQDVDAYYHK